MRIETEGRTSLTRVVVGRWQELPAQIRLWAAVRIAATASLLILLLSGVIPWSFRWYLLTAWVLRLGWQGVSTVARGQARRRRSRLRATLGTVGQLVWLAVALMPLWLFPAHHPIPSTGNYSVSAVSRTYVDNDRLETYRNDGSHRLLNVGFWYPDQPEGSFPLIVFSHGAFGIRTSNESLYRELASHGYVVCSIDHTYHCLFTRSTEGRTALINLDYLRTCSEEDAKANRANSYACYQQWMGIRTADIDFIIDQIIANSGNDPVCQMVDRAKIGVMGHSLGGSAALGIGRMRDDVGAVIALESPFLCDIQGVTDGEFTWNNQPYPVPVLNVYSDSSWGHLSEWPQYAANVQLQSSQPETVLAVHLAGSRHLALTDLSLSSPTLTRLLDGEPATISSEQCLSTINNLCLSFFDRWLKGAK